MTCSGLCPHSREQNWGQRVSPMVRASCGESHPRDRKGGLPWKACSSRGVQGGGDGSRHRRPDRPSSCECGVTRLNTYLHMLFQKHLLRFHQISCIYKCMYFPLKTTFIVVFRLFHGDFSFKR